MTFDDDQKPISVAEEIALFKECETAIRHYFPLFRIKIIVCGLKCLGNSHIQSMLDAMKSIKENADFVVGFDMVNEEDYNMPISDFLEQILIAREEMGADKL